MKLYIAEKPSMAAEVAKCLPGPLRRKDGYIETGDGIVTWGYGHILRQAEPGEYDEKYQRWRVEDLPIIPQQWKLLISESAHKQFSVVKGLIEKADEIVHAGDPDREGQLLVDEVLDYLDNKKPVKRLLLNALDEKSIKKALVSLRENLDFQNLKFSALGRQRADWLVGMNLSRAYTLAAQRAGHRVVLPVGRVKTPTLALVVRREREISEFKPADYFLLKAEFAHCNGSFKAAWRARDEQRGLDSEGRLVDAAIAEGLLQKLSADKNPARIVSCETAEKKEAQRLPFSLSALQVLAGRKFGYDPQTVLDTVQGLYEKKLTTYPRSDCDFLPESQHGDAAALLENLCAIAQPEIAAWAAKADAKIKSRAWNDKKITAHHAIIPTGEACNFAALRETERNLYFLIAQAYIAQFYPLHVYQQTKVEVEHAAEDFVANGRVIIKAGWKELYGVGAEEEKEGKEKDEEDSGTLPAMKKGDAAEFLNALADKKTTKPPQRFTTSTLLQAMKEIHKYVKNPELKKKLKDVSGIGTEATRATIIKELSDRGFMQEKKKYLYPTELGNMLIDALPEEMKYPDSTAVWEEILHRMAGGEASLDTFLEQQIRFVRTLCAKARGQARIPPAQGGIPCPRCGRGVMKPRNGKNGNFWGCSRYPDCRASCDDKDGKPDWKN